MQFKGVVIDFCLGGPLKHVLGGPHPIPGPSEPTRVEIGWGKISPLVPKICSKIIDFAQNRDF